MRLRKLEFFESQVSILLEFLNLIELGSFEEYYQSNEADSDILAGSVISLLNCSGSCLKVLKLQLSREAPVMEDMDKFLNAVQYLQEFQFELPRPGPKTAFVMNDLFLQLSSSLPVLEGGVPGLLPNLQSLKLYSSEGYMFDCIPDIFSWPHRRMLSLKVDGSWQIELDKHTSHKISHLIDEEFKISILRAGKNYF